MGGLEVEDGQPFCCPGSMARAADQRARYSGHMACAVDNADFCSLGRVLSVQVDQRIQQQPIPVADEYVIILRESLALACRGFPRRPQAGIP
jgi:hypothetical protein